MRILSQFSSGPNAKNWATGLFALSVLGLTLLMAVPAQADNDDCLACHGESDIEAVSESGKKLQLHLAENALKGGVHANVSCTDCHDMGEQADSHGDEGYKGELKFKCQDCHAQAVKDYAGSVHGQAKPGASCSDCHGDIHKVVHLKSQASPLSPLNQPETCGKCHAGQGMRKDKTVGEENILERYKHGVHGLSLKEGKPAASCSDCHKPHNIHPAGDAKASLQGEALLNACAKCHVGAVGAYKQGVHGKAFLRGNRDVPTCITCHDTHGNISFTAKDGRRSFAATDICIGCHGNKVMMGRYGLDDTQVNSFHGDIHGLIQKGSKGAAATCADCHDPHMTLPHTDKRANLYPSNRVQTCSKCHPAATTTFANSFSHKTRTQTTTLGGKIHFWVVAIYTLLILATIGGMLMHNFIIWSFFFRRKLRHVAKNAAIMRLTAAERVWHLFLLTSFITLVITGFALSFPDSWLYFWWPSVGLTENVRSTIHHIAGVINGGSMLIVVLWAAKRSGRQKWWFGMFPMPRDLFDFLKTMKYYLMLSDEKPKFAVFNYAEKFEYWALWWGTFVMVGTGFIMWFSPYMPASWPSWVFDLVRTIHFYEATLAALAIAVWHFFHVIYHPEEYPISTVMVSGVMDEHEATSRFDDEAIAAQAISPEDK